MIEKGRHLGIDKDLRFCPFCPGLVEDEKHFVTRCPQYRHLRTDLIRNAKNIIPSIQNHSDDMKFVYLLSQTPSLVAKFAANAIELREFLLESHRSFNQADSCITTPRIIPGNHLLAQFISSLDLYMDIYLYFIMILYL